MLFSASKVLYLVSDVLLLSDIWENFRSVCYKNYGLDCEYYYTAPGLSWDAMLKFTEIEQKLESLNAQGIKIKHDAISSKIKESIDLLKPK